VRIQIDSIDDRGREVRAGLGEAWAVRAADQALEATPEALSATLLFVRKGPAIFVTGKLEARFVRPCDRCAQGVVVSLSHDVDLKYAPEQGGTGEIELAEGDLDVGTFTGDALDLGDVLSEGLALALPTRYLCADTAACDARTTALFASSDAGATASSPFAALAGLVRDA